MKNSIVKRHNLGNSQPVAAVLDALYLGFAWTEEKVQSVPKV